MVTTTSSIKLFVNALTPYTDLLELICKTRGVQCDVKPQDGDDRFDLYDRNVLIRGFWPALEYLLSRYPMPELLVGDVTTRCIMRSLLNELLQSGKVDGIFLKPLAPNLWVAPFPCGQHAPNILDLAYIAVLPDCMSRRRLTDALDSFCRNSRQEAA